jgi:C1A family cysteine protease
MTAIMAVIIVLWSPDLSAPLAPSSGGVMALRRLAGAGKRAYGWVRDLPDHRDHLFLATRATLAQLPASVDLSEFCPPVYDQGHLGACTANALAAAFALALRSQRQRVFAPSRLFIYYNERVMEGTVASDAGAQLRDGIKTLNAQGVCPESLWPYQVAKFTQKPPAPAYAAADKHQLLRYEHVLQSLTQMKGCLAEGRPFVLGFAVYEGFEGPQMAKTGVGQLPGPQERRVGGHAVLCVGYDDASHCFRLRNSWGAQWGQAGYFTLPYAYLTDPGLAADFWTMEIIEG